MPEPVETGRRARVVVLRGHQANPWELRPWELIGDRYEVSYLRSARNWFDTGLVGVHAEDAPTMRGLLPRGRLGDMAVRVPGDRYLGLAKHLAGADIVHAQELGYWYSMQAAREKAKAGYKLVLNVWETIPFGREWRNVRTRRYRDQVLAAADLFLPATERARDALVLEGAPAERIRICPPGIDTSRFSPDDQRSEQPLVLSPGRLVWEKGHQDVIRALALLRRSGRAVPRLVIVGRGPEEARLRAYANELGVADLVELRGFVPYDEMPALYAAADCLVLASLPIWSWEEQFGMVLVEALAAGVPIVASMSGAIPEVAGPSAAYFAPGDWVALADSLELITAERAPRAVADPERVQLFSAEAAAERLAAAYDELLTT